MYKLLLILRYLRRKLVPLFAALAVMLCTAMVIIVISVMGGFLEMMRSSTHKLSGDVSLRADLTGFPDYQELLTSVNALPGVAAATPLIRTWGLLKIGGRVTTVEVVGVDPDGISQVTEYRDSLYWTPENIRASLESSYKLEHETSPELRALLNEREKSYIADDLVPSAMSLKSPKRWGDLPGIVPGIGVNPFGVRDGDGNYLLTTSAVGATAVLTVLPLSREGDVLEERPPMGKFAVVNEFKSGMSDVDSQRVYMSLPVLQKMLRMDSVPAHDESGEPTGRMTASRVSEILVRAKPGVDLVVLRQSLTDLADRFVEAHAGVPPLTVETWEERHAVFLGAVEKEKGLLVVLFAIISVVAVAMIAVIFYMIVLEKTHDIGVLRALGASRRGIMAIFLGYGLGIGVLGAALGLTLAATVVWNINEIQDILFKVFHFKMWDPAIYVFDKIPSKLNPHEVTVIVIAAALSGVVGALLPAYLAGRLNPVEALRYE